MNIQNSHKFTIKSAIIQIRESNSIITIANKKQRELSRISRKIYTFANEPNRRFWKVV